MEVRMEKREPEVSPDEIWAVEGHNERRTPEVSPDPPPWTSFRSSSSSSSLFSSFRSGSFDFSGYPPQSELEEVPSLRWLPDGLRPAGTAHSSTADHSWSGNSIGERLPTTLRIEGEILSSLNLKVFTFKELKGATRNFRLDYILGEGGFGPVYKGWIDEHTLSASRSGSGLAIAVKKLKPESIQGHEEWLAEVKYLGKLHHPNLVNLIGYCSEGDDRLLVYEFLPRGSLDNHLFRRGGGQPLSWATRIKVAVGVATGLSFLHDLEIQVIHRHVHTSDILLDAEFNAKLSDFGLARAGPTGDMTHVTTRVMGTYGYAAPEYVATGQLTAKADVYGFGVVLLELLSGRRAIDPRRASGEHNLVEWVKPYLRDKRELFRRIMDPRMEGQYAKRVAFTVADLALRCLSNDPKLRPPMSEVSVTLEEQYLKYSKDTAKLTQMEQGNASSHVPRSPMGRHHHPSPLRPPLGGSRLPSQRRFPWIW